MTTVRMKTKGSRNDGVEVEHGAVGEVVRVCPRPHEVYQAMASGDGDAPHAGRQPDLHP
jgi:hypothetical protein